MLYLIATPIGNLADFSQRAVEILKNSDYILCEDTRHSAHLLKHYQISTPLRSYHSFNERKELDAIVNDLKNQKTLALISDAGTPVLCDPGHLLVECCREQGIEVTSIGGPCAALLALISSGLPPLPFQFLGFLPKKATELNHHIRKMFTYEGTSIAYETPHRIEKTLEAIAAIDPSYPLCIARELTKLHEEFLFGNAPFLLEHFAKTPPRGELVLLTGPTPSPPDDWSYLSLKEHVLQVQKTWNLSFTEAIKRVAEIRQLPKRTVYQSLHEKTTDS